MEKKKGYTIDDIARELGISKTTVSRAISGKGRISPATVQRVREFTESHDYHPNVMAQGLAQRKTYNLGLILPKEYGETEIPFFKECMNGIFATASAYNYDIVLSMADGNDSTQVERQIANQKLDGMILSRAMEDSEIQKLLIREKVPFVVIGEMETPGAVWVDNDNRGASRELTELLLMMGLRSLAILGGDPRFLVTGKRLEGFSDAHQSQKIKMKDSQVFLGIDTPAKTMHAVDQILESGADGIICMDDFICNMTLGCLREKGVAVPGNIRVASLYDSRQMEFNLPPVTGLKFSTEALGRRACLMLLRVLGEEITEEIPQIHYQVILRESTKMM